MSNLEDILKEYRHSCFLAKDLNLNDKAVTLVANQQIVTYGKIKALMLELIGEDEPKAISGNVSGHTLRQERNKVRAELRKKVEEL